MCYILLIQIIKNTVELPRTVFLMMQVELAICRGVAYLLRLAISPDAAYALDYRR